jgi:hypothetical protein
MAKDREISCIYYEAERHCRLGKEGTFRKYCQHCQCYKAVRGGQPARTDTRASRLARIRRKEDR